jgi:hypothetical protein
MERPGTRCKEAGLATGPVWTGAENLASTGIQSPDYPARSESLYRLRYPGPFESCIEDTKHARTRTHARKQAHTRAHTHTQISLQDIPDPMTYI